VLVVKGEGEVENAGLEEDPVYGKHHESENMGNFWVGKTWKRETSRVRGRIEKKNGKPIRKSQCRGALTPTWCDRGKSFSIPVWVVQTQN